MINITQTGPDDINVLTKEDISKNTVVNRLIDAIMSIKGVKSGINATMSAVNNDKLTDIVILYPEQGVVITYDITKNELKSITKNKDISCQSEQFIKQYLTDDMGFIETLPIDILKEEMDSINSNKQELYTAIVSDLYEQHGLESTISGSIYRVRMADLIISYDRRLNTPPTIRDITDPMMTEVKLNYPPMHTVYITRAIMSCASKNSAKLEDIKYQKIKNKWLRGGW